MNPLVRIEFDGSPVWKLVRFTGARLLRETGSSGRDHRRPERSGEVNMDVTNADPTFIREDIETFRRVDLSDAA